MVLYAAGFAHAQTVAFINPGKTGEHYWETSAQAMQAAADSLGMKLEVHYAQREHPRAFELARSLVARPPAERPQYVVLSNDYSTGPELLRILEGSGIRTLMAFSRLTPEQRATHGGPRQQFKDWIGSLEPRALDAGYQTARALIQQGRAAKAYAPDGKLHLLMLAGDRSTTSSILRNEGMRRAVAEAKDVVVDQEAYASWSREGGQEKAAWLLDRHPQARLVWAGNDLMAFGAMDAVQERGGTPGKTMWFSGVNTSPEALQAVQSGRMAALSGGHFITGAWAMVMIHDYHHGKDFASEGLELERSMFALLTPALAQRYLQRWGSGFGGVDFRQYSKVHNPRVKKYDFGFAQLLR